MYLSLGRGLSPERTRESDGVSHVAPHWHCNRDARGRRRTAARNALGSPPPFLAGAFGGFVGGIIGDGLPHAQGTDFNMPSIVGAILGALIFCMAVRGRASDEDS